MALLDLQGMESKGKDPKDHSGLSALICGGDDSSISLVLC